MKRKTQKKGLKKIERLEPCLKEREDLFWIGAVK